MFLHSGGSAWAIEPGVAAAVFAGAAAYTAGVRRAWRRAGTGRGVSRVQVWSFAGGMLVVAIALLSPLDAMANELFSAHMTQHVLLTVVAPPLLVIGAPEIAALWALAPAHRRRFVLRIRDARWAGRVWFAITAPAVAWTLHFVAVWSWHDPRLYEMALRSDVAHALEHLSFVGSGVLLWWRIVHPRAVARRTAYAVGLMTLFFTAAHEGALGALFTISHRLFYPTQATGAAAHGLTPLEDQQLAGLVMWIPGGMVYLIAMSVVFMLWFEGTRPAGSGRHPATVGSNGR